MFGILPATAPQISVRLTISTTEDGAVNYTIRSLSAGVLQTGQVSKESPQSQTISLFNIVNIDTDRYKGIEVTTGSSKKLSVVVSAGDPNEAGYAYQALPPWGYNTDEYIYYGAGLEDTTVSAGDSKATALIVAANNDTEITLTPKNAAITIPADLAPNGIDTTVAPGSTITFTMDYLWTFLIKNDQLSGLKIVSNKPISFFVRHECVALPAREFFCDAFAEQLAPGRNEFFLTSVMGIPLSGMQLEVVPSAHNNTIVTLFKWNLTANHFFCIGYISVNVSSPVVTVNAGSEAAILDCMVSGVPTPIVTWSHNGDTISSSDRFNIDSEGVLRIMNTQMSDMGVYKCNATNGYHQMEGNISLRNVQSELS